jgi:hypothetical protein
MPPMVAREAVETSTGNHRPCGFNCRLSSSSTMPGSTTQRGSRRRDRECVRCFEQSTDQRLVHGLAALRGAAAARQHARALPHRPMAIARSASSMVRGTTTPTGIIW